MRLLIYEKPSAYLIIHIFLGIISIFYTPLLWIFLGYQFLQLILNKRFFLFEWRIKNGNSIELCRLILSFSTTTTSIAGVGINTGFTTV